MKINDGTSVLKDQEAAATALGDHQLLALDIVGGGDDDVDGTAVWNSTSPRSLPSSSSSVCDVGRRRLMELAAAAQQQTCDA